MAESEFKLRGREFDTIPPTMGSTINNYIDTLRQSGIWVIIDPKKVSDYISQTNLSPMFTHALHIYNPQTKVCGIALSRMKYIMDVKDLLHEVGHTDLIKRLNFPSGDLYDYIPDDLKEMYAELYIGRFLSKGENTKLEKLVRTQHAEWLEQFEVQIIGSSEQPLIDRVYAQIQALIE